MLLGKISWTRPRDIEKLGGALHQQLQVSNVYEAREQGRATDAVEQKNVGRVREGMIVLVAIVKVVAGS